MKDISGWTLRHDPARIAALRAEGIWRDRTIADEARALRETDPGRVTHWDGTGAHDVAGLLGDAEALAAALWSRGLRPGDVISMQLPNWREAIVVDLAAVLIGLVVNPIVPIYRDAEVGLILADCRARAVFAPEVFRGLDFVAMLERLAPDLPDLGHIVFVRNAEARPGDFASLLAEGRGLSVPWPRVAPEAAKLIMYTSGTTGRPKGVLHSHETLRRALDMSAAEWRLDPGSVFLMPSPVTHVTGYSFGIEMPFLCGTRTVLMEKWNADEALDLVERHGANATVGATPFLQELADAAARQGRPLPTFRVFACGGAAVPPELVRRARETFADCAVCRVYGSTEAPMITQGFVRPGEDRLAAETDGRIVGYEVKIVDDDGRPLPPGGEGEIMVRGPALFLGYADAGQTADSFDGEGFFRTGDIGIVGADDSITITGRKKDLIIRGGENLSAKEIEDALHRHPAIREAAAVSMPHARLGETVCAYVVPAGDARPDLAELVAFLDAAGLAKQKFPERLELVDDFPRTASGKIRKDVLRRMIAEKLG